MKVFRACCGAPLSPEREGRPRLEQPLSHTVRTSSSHASSLRFPCLLMPSLTYQRNRPRKGSSPARPDPRLPKTLNRSARRAKQAPPGSHTRTTLGPGPQSRTTTDRHSAKLTLSDVTYPATYDSAKAGPLNSADIAMNTKPATETPNQREFLLSQLSPPERQTVESHLGGLSGPDGGTVHRAVAQRGLAVEFRPPLGVAIRSGASSSYAMKVMS